MKEGKDTFDELAEVCRDYIEGRISAPVLDVMVEGLAGKCPEPLRSHFYRAAEKSVGEHRCHWWHDCRSGLCCYEGNEETWEERFRGAGALWTLIESEGVN